MAYIIELGLDKVDHEKQTVTVHGLKVSFKYLEEIIVTPMLNSLKPSDGAAVGIMRQLAAAGLRTHIWRDFANHASEVIQREREELARQAEMSRQAAERMRVQAMTPAEIQKENQAREAARLETIAKFRNKGAGAFSN